MEVVEKEKQNAGVDIGEDYFSDEGEEKSNLLLFLILL